MKYHFLPFAFLILPIHFLTSCGHPSQPGKQAEPSTLIIDSLRSTLTMIPDSSLIPGFAVSVIQKDSVLFNEGFGYADVKAGTPFTNQTAHTIASISKTFIAVAIMQLIEKGKISLDQEVNDILPFKVRSPHFPDHPITIKHLVTHSSSLNDDFDDGDKRTSWLVDSLPENYKNLHPDIQEDIFYYDGVEASIQDFLISFCTPEGKWYAPSNYSDFAPGTTYEYSNAGATVAALIVELVSELSFADYTQKYIFDPLDMRNTSWFYQDLEVTYSKLYVEKEGAVYEFPRYHEASYPDGQLKTTSTDLTKFHLEMMRGIQGKGTLLTAESYTNMFSDQLPRSAFPEPDEDKINDEYAVGVFWARSAPGYILHTGGMIGVYSILYFNPASEVGMIALCNLAHPDFGQILSALDQCELALERVGEINGQKE